MGRPWRRAAVVSAILAFTIAGLAWLYAGCIDTEAAGFLHDDGVYAITARAIADGDGPRLVHRPNEPIQVRYPILYPLILALGWTTA